MQPSSSDLYESSLITVPASFPRYPGAVIIPQTSNKPEDYRLQICYRKYKTKSQISDVPKVNIVFLHGNGMNKGIWHYHVDKLFNHFKRNEKSNYQINSVLAIDTANHGDSAAINKDKLGHVYGWYDGSKDVIDIVKKHESEDFFSKNTINLLVGHSMGGFQALYTCYLEPELFDCCIPINPVCYMDDETAELHLFAFNTWYQSGKIKSHFDIPAGSNWKDVIENHYKKESFFKKFDPTVVANMIEDELNGDLKHDNVSERVTVDLNTPAIQEYICYYNSQVFVPHGMEVFDKVTTPVYHVVGDKDTTSENGIQSTRHVLKSVLTPLDIEDSTHLVIGENPDLVVNVLIKAIDQSIDRHQRDGDSRYREEKLQENYGIDYKNIIMAKEFAAYISASKNGTKLYKL